MKLFKSEPTNTLSITIDKKRDTRYYFKVTDISQEAFVKWLTSKIELLKCSPFTELTKVSISIRDCPDGKNGNTETVSFIGFNTSEIYDYLLNEIEKESFKS